MIAARGRQRWKFVGPDYIPQGQTYGSGGNDRPPVSGRIAGVAIDPRDRRRILIASAGGGIWSSSNGGRTWVALTDFQPTLSMGAIAFAPSRPTVVYAGTGEGDTFSQLGAGLLRSTDGGATWRLLRHRRLQDRGVFDIAVDPTDHRRLLVATWDSLLRSADGGRRWIRARGELTWDLSVNPADPREVFAACQDGGYRSTNGGRAWSRVALSGWNGRGASRIEVCHAPSDGGVVYVVAAIGARAYIWRRSTRGGRFSRQQAPGGLSTTQSWYDWCAAVKPDDPSVLYLGAIELFRGTRRSNSQWRWSNISSRSSGDSIHPDQHHIAFAPDDPATVYIANDGGLFRSPDSGRTWQALNRGLGITEFEYLAQHPRKLSWILGGTQDNGTLRHRSGRTWDQVAFGDGGDCGIDESAPDTCYHSYYGLGLERSDRGGDWGSWQWDPVGRAPALFYPPLEVNGEVVAQGGSTIYISRSGGAPWDTVDLPNTAPDPGDWQLASALAIWGDSEILVGTTNGKVYRILHDGVAWGTPALVAVLRPAGYISDLCVDPSDPNWIWATSSTLGGSHVFLSRDDGVTWEVRDRGLPDIPVNAIISDPKNKRRVFIGTDHGVYRSTNGGRTWRDFSADLPNAIVGDILFHARRRVLRIGTRNRGVWELKL